MRINIEGDTAFHTLPMAETGVFARRANLDFFHILFVLFLSLLGTSGIFSAFPFACVTFLPEEVLLWF